MSSLIYNLKVTDEIAITQKGLTDLNAEKISETKISAWKSTVKKAKTDILQLASSTPAQGSNDVPSPFGNVKIDVPKTDLSARK